MHPYINKDHVWHKLKLLNQTAQLILRIQNGTDLNTVFGASFVLAELK